MSNPDIFYHDYQYQIVFSDLIHQQDETSKQHYQKSAYYNAYAFAILKLKRDWPYLQNQEHQRLMKKQNLYIHRVYLVLEAKEAFQS
ncbi:hypothetical protein D3C86_1341140 [compost metagenome]